MKLTYAIGFGSSSSIVADGDPETKTLYALYESDDAQLNDDKYNGKRWGCNYGYENNILRGIRCNKQRYARRNERP